MRVQSLPNLLFPGCLHIFLLLHCKPHTFSLLCH